MSGLESVLVVGTGLIGTSIALALREQDVVVYLADRDAGAVRLARELGAGTEWADGMTADIAIIAVPPQLVAGQLAELQRAGAARFYTDVASVKVLPLRQAASLGCDMSTYVAGHPLAGRERRDPRRPAPTCSSAAVGPVPDGGDLTRRRGGPVRAHRGLRRRGRQGRRRRA